MNAAIRTDLSTAVHIQGLNLRGGHHQDDKDHEPLQRTLAIIKPDAADKAEEIKSIIKEKGFKIVQEKRITLTKQQVSAYMHLHLGEQYQLVPLQAQEFYREHKGKPFYDGLVAFMTSGEGFPEPRSLDLRSCPEMAKTDRTGRSPHPAKGRSCQGVARSHGTHQLQQGPATPGPART